MWHFAIPLLTELIVKTSFHVKTVVLVTAIVKVSPIEVNSITAGTLGSMPLRSFLLRSEEVYRTYRSEEKAAFLLLYRAPNAALL